MYEVSLSELIRLRREFHMYPELGFCEKETAKRIISEIKDFELDIREKVAKTGLVVKISGKDSGRCVLLRADMDALPIKEKNSVPYRSRVKGVMHACGHDGHMAIMIGVVKALASLRDQFSGVVKVIFQPAEEKGNGALSMIEEGILENPPVDFALALHLWNELPLGRVALSPGVQMAAIDGFSVEVLGKGGHGATPHWTKDPIVAASHMIVSLQTIISRRISPAKAAVISIGKICGGKTANVIPERVVFEGTVRSCDKKTRDKIEDSFKEIINGVAKAMDVSVEIDYETKTPILINDSYVTGVVRDVAKEIVGDENVIDAKVSLGGDDMAFILEKVKGCYFRVGSSNPNLGLVSHHHTENFDFDERALEVGFKIMLGSTLKLLEETG